MTKYIKIILPGLGAIGAFLFGILLYDNVRLARETMALILLLLAIASLAECITQLYLFITESHHKKENEGQVKLKVIFNKDEVHHTKLLVADSLTACVKQALQISKKNNATIVRMDKLN